MTTNEKREKLIELFKGKQTATFNDYRKKITSMTNAQIEQEYDMIVEGKIFKHPKQKKVKKTYKEKMTYEKVDKDMPEW